MDKDTIQKHYFAYYFVYIGFILLKGKRKFNSLARRDT